MNAIPTGDSGVTFAVVVSTISMCVALGTLFVQWLNLRYNAGRLVTVDAEILVNHDACMKVTITNEGKRPIVLRELRVIHSQDAYGPALVSKTLDSKLAESERSEHVILQSELVANAKRTTDHSDYNRRLWVMVIHSRTKTAKVMVAIPEQFVNNALPVQARPFAATDTYLRLSPLDFQLTHAAYQSISRK